MQTPTACRCADAHQVSNRGHFARLRRVALVWSVNQGSGANALFSPACKSICVRNKRHHKKYTDGSKLTKKMPTSKKLTKKLHNAVERQCGLRPLL